MINSPGDNLIDGIERATSWSGSSGAKSVTSARLNSIDWDFPERRAHSGIEGLHPYPAKFVAELPGALLDVLSVPPETRVLDPFCGSGTTLVECQRRAIPSVGVDLNPIACLISRVKTQPVPADVVEVSRTLVYDAKESMDVPIPKIPNLDHWFMKPVQHAIASLTSAINRRSELYRDYFRFALSSIIVRVSNQESDTRYAAIKKTVTPDDVFFLFYRATIRMFETLSERRYSISGSEVIEADTLSLSSEQLGKVGLVITSPPYPNAYEYWLYHKYRMWWLGFDPIYVKYKEIGARAHFFRKDHHTGTDFLKQMKTVFRLLSDSMIPEGLACFVVGRSRIHGEIVDNASSIKEAGAYFGFDEIFSTERTLPATRKSFNLSHANIKRETVMVLGRRPS